MSYGDNSVSLNLSVRIACDIGIINYSDRSAEMEHTRVENLGQPGWPTEISILNWNGIWQNHMEMAVS